MNCVFHLYLYVHTICTIRFLSSHYQELQELFPLDPLLVLSVAYVCPKREIANLCDQIHLPYAISLVVNRVKNMSYLSGHTPVEVYTIFMN